MKKLMMFFIAVLILACSLSLNSAEFYYNDSGANTFLIKPNTANVVYFNRSVVLPIELQLELPPSIIISECLKRLSIETNSISIKINPRTDIGYHISISAINKNSEKICLYPPTFYDYKLPPKYLLIYIAKYWENEKITKKIKETGPINPWHFPSDMYEYQYSNFYSFGILKDGGYFSIKVEFARAVELLIE